MEKDIEWVELPQIAPGCRSKILIPQAAGPEVALFELPPDTPIVLAPPFYGRYEVVAAGSIEVGGRTLTRAGLRYVIGDELPSPLRSGPDGATLITLAFDADALSGGLTEDWLGAAAAEAMAKAI